MTNLMHWKLIIAVAELGNVSRAAQVSGISQSGASQAIKQMEASLGVPLFVRESKSVLVTEIGEQIIAGAKRMVSELESIQHVIDKSKGFHLGRIRIATFPSVFASFINEFMDSFKRSHPSVDIIALPSTDEETKEWLSENKVDLGIILNPESDSQGTMIGCDSWVAAIPTGHSLSRRGSQHAVTLTELVNEPFIVATGGCHVHGQTLLEKEGLQLKQVAMRVKNWTTAFELIGEGLGVSIVPASMVPADNRKMRFYPLSPPLYRHFALACSEKGKNSPVVQEFITQLRQSKGNRTFPVEIGVNDIPL